MSVLPLGPHERKTPAGVLYPSIAANTFGDNVAIKPAYLDSEFNFVAALWLKVINIIDGATITSHTQPVASCQVSEVGFADREGRIAWSPHPTNSPVFSQNLCPPEPSLVWVWTETRAMQVHRTMRKSGQGRIDLRDFPILNANKSRRSGRPCFPYAAEGKKAGGRHHADGRRRPWAVDSTDIGLGDEPGLKPLHGDPAFEALVARAREHAKSTASAKPGC